MLIRCLFLSLFFFFSTAVSPALALTIAVFPIEDLSQGQNGMNAELSSYIAWEMDRRGFDVIGNDEVISFMARNRVRWLGFLDSRHILMAKDELGAELVLFGTMSLREQDLSPSLGLTLFLVRTSDTKTLWTGSGGLAQQDIVNLLGIGQPAQGEGLMPKLAQSVLAKWPQDLDYGSKPQHALEIENINLEPSQVRQGDKITCSVRLRTTWSEEDAPRIFFKAAGRVYMARKEEPGDVYSGDWEITDVDGRYPVTMVMNWPSGHKKVAYLGAYNVDSSPPKLVLDLKGVQLEGTVAFRDQVIIIPRMLRREPVARWKLTVEDANGEEQLTYTGHGEMPSRFVWNGKGKDGWPVAEGVYNVNLQVWDRADNMSVATQPVAVARTPPSMVLEAKNRGRDMIVDLSHDGKVPIAFWRFEMRNSDGETIKVAEGSDLPVRLDLDIPAKLIKIAEGLAPPPENSSNLIKVAEGEGEGRRLIKVAEGEGMPLEGGRRLIKVAEGEEMPLGGGRRIIKVAEGEEVQLGQGRRVIKVAEGEVLQTVIDKRKIIKLAGGPPSQTDVQRDPEDEETRRVECLIIIRDILGNQTKTKIQDLQGFADKQLKDTEAVVGTPVWIDEF